MHSFEETSAAFSKRRKKIIGKCHACGKKGHMQRDCRMNKGDVNLAADYKSVVFMADSGSAQQESDRKLEFLLDLGASKHLEKLEETLFIAEVAGTQDNY